MNLGTSEHNSDFPHLIQPVSEFDLSHQVLSDRALSKSEKRAILSSWASDANAVESRPWLGLRQGAANPVSLAAILTVLQLLDGEPPRPRGGAGVRPRREHAFRLHTLSELQRQDEAHESRAASAAKRF